ncbi:nitrate reductase molybdenum cofactor assembly chaperone [uncultured Rhodoblastus sp.]|uniref:nitrate reductase molybdenum cofactor assembly chaperone n=1 Tax=uncultured Rhodoblastus sp. TaxID=543037 RepID=UPI0025E2F52D|nr:nitrate reductase molybdenum cofactor assembly chaperone [uncultured Rhodoblastus sp.]
MQTFRALSAILSYPSQPFLDALDEIGAVIEREALAPPVERRALLALLEQFKGRDLYELQEQYGLLFDRTRSLSLHLFEHVHGESRDRGQAMIDLKAVYEAKDLHPDPRELPDFLPLFLEFASLLDLEAARELLEQPAHVFTALAERLRKRDSGFEVVFLALIAIARAKPDAALLEVLRAEPDPAPDDFEALDAAYDEAPVDFGEGDDPANCGKDTLAAKLRQARRPAPGLETKGQRPVFTHSTNI